MFDYWTDQGCEGSRETNHAMVLVGWGRYWYWYCLSGIGGLLADGWIIGGLLGGLFGWILADYIGACWVGIGKGIGEKSHSRLLLGIITIILIYNYHHHHHHNHHHSHHHGDDDEKGGGERAGLLGGKKQLGCQLGGERIHEVK